VALPVLEHALVPAGDPELITTRDGLARLLDKLRAAGRFGYDSEFIGEQSYHPQLCVIQVSTAERVSLIDPLAGLDFTPFWELLADPSVEKIVHAGTQDLEPVGRHLGRPPERVFDVQIAAAFAGLPYPSALGKLVLALTGAELSPGLKFSQWDHRPLTPTQLRYAANDVRYLPLLRQALGERLEAAGHAAWAEEECATLSDAALYANDPDSVRLRVRGVELLDARQLGVLRALLAWRDAAAREQDVPPRSLVKDGILLDMARWPIGAVDDLRHVRGLPRPVEQRWGRSILEASRAGGAAPVQPTSNGKPRTGEKQKARLEALWAAVQDRCRAAGVDPAIATSKKELGAWLAAAEAGAPSSDSRLTRGWRRELLLAVLEGATSR
jgi:ribonuclease D